MKNDKPMSIDWKIYNHKLVKQRAKSRQTIRGE